jgi:hypothetical protein
MRIGIEVGGTRHREHRNHPNSDNNNDNTNEPSKKGNDGIILESDTPQSASEKLTPYALAGNLEALYMYALCLCKYFHYLFLDHGSLNLLLSRVGSDRSLQARHYQGVLCSRCWTRHLLAQDGGISRVRSGFVRLGIGFA